MLKTQTREFWFVTGSQHLYGPETLREVELHSQQIAAGLSGATEVNYPVVNKPVLTTAEEIRKLCLDANSDESCAGIITWMHTFSPAKMWIGGLSVLIKPMLHFHTQFNRDIPWERIDMDFMNLNQSAHGDREFGFIGARMNLPRKVVVGYWQDEQVLGRIGKWMHTADAFSESQKLKVARFGDNMRSVAVTEGDKVEAQIKFGWSINGYGIGDLHHRMQEISDEEVERLYDDYIHMYDISSQSLSNDSFKKSVLHQAHIELGIESFLQEGNYTAFTTTFEDLHGLNQLPGLAAQRLMEKGYGFAAEGDWKTAALLRMMKIMAGGKGTSFMEDYTYHMAPEQEMVLGSHMLEICPTISADTPKIEVHPLSIGGKDDPARMVFNGRSGSALNASLVDLGHRFRLIVNEVEALEPEHSMPQLPVARVLWKPKPTFQEAAESWIHAGGAHHTVFSYEVTTEQLFDLTDMFSIENVTIDAHSTPMSIRQELKWNNLAWKI